MYNVVIQEHSEQLLKHDNSNNNTTNKSNSTSNPLIVYLYCKIHKVTEFFVVDLYCVQCELANRVKS